MKKNLQKCTATILLSLLLLGKFDNIINITTPSHDCQPLSDYDIEKAAG